MHDESLTIHGPTFRSVFHEVVFNKGDVPAMLADLGLETDVRTIHLPFNEPERLEGFVESHVQKWPAYFGTNVDRPTDSDANIAELIFQIETNLFHFISDFESGQLIAEGRISPISHDLKRDVIRRGWWRDLRALASVNSSYLKSLGSSPEDRILFSDIRVFTREEWATLAHGANDSKKHATGGRQPKFNWEEIWAEIACRVHDGGLPESREQFIEELQSWCIETWQGEPPSRTSLQRRVNKLLNKIGDQ